MFDDLQPGLELPPDTWERGPGARRAPPSLVLFVGEGYRPGVQERAALGRGGTRCLWMADPEQAQKAARLARFDAVVLDADAVRPPFGAALARLRQRLACPMIVIAESGAGSAAHAADETGQDIEEIMALELGADVYLRRPVLPRRLNAHLVALLRRQPLPAQTASLPAAHQAFRAPGTLTDLVSPERMADRIAAWSAAAGLTGTQAALLRCLVAARGSVVERPELIAALPVGQSLRARTIDTHVHRLRRRLEATGMTWLCIESVHGRGYVLQAAQPPLSSRAAA